MYMHLFVNTEYEINMKCYMGEPILILPIKDGFLVMLMLRIKK